MTREELRAYWLQEEAVAHIHGWDFSHIAGRCEEENDLPWDYDTVVRGYLKDDMRLLDYDTGGGEYLLSLCHPHKNTAATEGYPPNIAVCRETLAPLGIDFRPCGDPAHIPFPDGSFDMIINRHGDFEPRELFRLLKPGGVFVTQQVGADNDRDLVERVLPGLEKPFPTQTLARQKPAFEQAGFMILQAQEAYRPIVFTDIGAFVWFARIISWEFPGFSVDACFDRLMDMQAELEQKGSVRGTVHRFLIAARKP